MLKVTIDWRKCSWAKWWAMNADGECYFYDSKPKIDLEKGCWAPKRYSFKKCSGRIKNSKMLKYWAETLVKTPSFKTDLYICETAVKNKKQSLLDSKNKKLKMKS